jgi:oxalyl-CoA decarboxylase
MTSTTQIAPTADRTPTLRAGSQLVIDALELNGVSTIYGVPGTPVTDLSRLAQAKGIRYVGFRHEASAGNAAAATGFLTRRPGICMTTSGSGFLNGLVALANATTNCFPMIQISGSAEGPIGDPQRGGHEEVDQLAAAKPLVKAAYRISRVQDIGRGVAQAFRTAASGRPGGVYLDIPRAVLMDAIEAGAGARSLWRIADLVPSQLPTRDALDRALGLLYRAERPLVVLGKAAAYARAEDEVRGFLESTGLPFLATSMAQGLMPDGHPHDVATGLAPAIARADVVMLVGAGPGSRLGHGEVPEWSPDATFIQVDTDAAELDGHQPVAAPLVGDIGSMMTALTERSYGVITPAAWRDELSACRAQTTAASRQRPGGDISPMRCADVVGAVKHVLADRADMCLVNEGAGNLDGAGNDIDMRQPRHRLDGGNAGGPGVGLGYAIAAAVETGDPVVAIIGGGAFAVSGMELETVCRYRLPITVIVLNDGAEARHERVIEAFGGTGRRVTTPDELERVVRAALSAGAPVLIDCMLEPRTSTEAHPSTNIGPSSLMTSIAPIGLPLSGDRSSPAPAAA